MWCRRLACPARRQSPPGRDHDNSYNAQGQEYQSDVYSVDQPTGNVGVNPEITKTLYDCDGNVISTTDPRNKTTTDSYDGLGNLVSTTDADNGTTYYTYDADGNQVTETDPMGDTTTNTYNRLDQLVSTIDANGRDDPLHLRCRRKSTHRNRPAGQHDDQHL